jgi:hypothetical protein
MLHDDLLVSPFIKEKVEGGVLSFVKTYLAN